MKIAYRRTTAELAGKWTHEIIITHEDLTEATANTAQTVPLLTLPAHAAVLNAGFYLKTPFKNSGDNAFNTTTLIVGDAGDTDRLLTSKELNENGTEILSWVTPHATDTIPFAYTTATVINAIFGSMSAKSLADLNTGEVHILLEVSELAAIS